MIIIVSVGYKIILNDNKKYFKQIVITVLIFYFVGKQTVLARRATSVTGLALDWISKLLYFTDSRRRTISVVDVKGNTFDDRRDLVVNVTLPKSVAVHPGVGYVKLSLKYILHSILLYMDPGINKRS